MSLPHIQPDNAVVAGLAMSATDALALQDQLLCAATELERLQRLLHDAASSLLQHFGGAQASLRDATDPAVKDAIGQAVQALQFQDLATQLIEHTRQRVQHCADRLSCFASSSDDEDGAALVQAAPQRPNPVIQDEMDSGLIELF